MSRFSGRRVLLHLAVWRNSRHVGRAPVRSLLPELEELELEELELEELELEELEREELEPIPCHLASLIRQVHC
jgi:hypothetical protein